MTAMRLVAMAGVAMLAAGCASGSGSGGEGSAGRYAAGNFKAEAALKTGAGADAGSVSAQEKDGGLVVTVKVTGVAPGVHGVHVHTTGKCEGPDFTTAGGHWNPGGKQHGVDNPAGSHAGDLPNMTVAADGTGTLSFVIPSTSLAAMLDEDGASLVVHAAADDLKTDPSGNSGARIACGVFGAV